MRKTFFLWILFGLALALVFWIARMPGDRAATVPGPTKSPDGTQEPPSFPGTNTRFTMTRTASAPEPSAENAVRDYVERIMADPTYDWKQQIDFYGRVVDESNKPVAGADIHFLWNDLSPQGTSRATAKSDAQGLFSLLNRSGKGLSVTVSNTGYYSSANARHASFEYANPADRHFFSPDPTNPVVFHLRKKGQGVDLITSQNGVKKHLGVQMPLDGTPVWVDLIHRKSSPNAGQILMSQQKPPYELWKDAVEWSFHMEIPDGGFIEQSDEFPFQAPEEGYQPALNFTFQKGQPDWATVLKRDFYIKFGSPARYGRLHLETLIEMAGARLTYAINANGSRNLEPKGSN